MSVELGQDQGLVQLVRDSGPAIVVAVLRGDVGLEHDESVFRVEPHPYRERDPFPDVEIPVVVELSINESAIEKCLETM